MKYYVVDAFTDTLFGGNPAGVCLPDCELDDATMQNIAAENNLSETAFVWKRDGFYDLRWFTPVCEIALCGHATLGSAYVLTHFVDPDASELRFETKSGTLTVTKADDLYILDFPARQVKPVEVTAQMEQAIGARVLEAYTRAEDLLLLLEDENTIAHLSPDFEKVNALSKHAVTVTAKGDTVDYVSRFFAPNMGIPEDPVTGSAHCTLIPFWAKRFGKSKLTARQLSKRGGRLWCEDADVRVKIGGKAVLYLTGEINVGGAP